MDDWRVLVRRRRKALYPSAFCRHMGNLCPRNSSILPERSAQMIDGEFLAIGQLFRTLKRLKIHTDASRPGGNVRQVFCVLFGLQQTECIRDLQRVLPRRIRRQFKELVLATASADKLLEIALINAADEFALEVRRCAKDHSAIGLVLQLL